MDFLTVADFAKLMHIKQAQAYVMLTSGVAPSIKINGRRRIPRAAWDAWYAEQTAKALAAVRTEPWTPQKVVITRGG